MSKGKAFLAVVLVLLLSFTAGCGSTDEQEEKSSTAQVQEVKKKEEILEKTEADVAQQENKSEEETQTSVVLKKTPAKNANELAQIIEEVIKATGGVEECYVIGAEEEVSTGGYWLGAEVKLSDAKNAWQVARNGVLAAYLNKDNVPLVKVSVNIMAPPEDKMYALQVSAGKNHFDGETLKFLKNGTDIDFQAWIKENQTRGGYKQYAEDLWAQGPLAF